MARFARLRNGLHWRIIFGGVIVGDEHQRERHRQSHQRGDVIARAADAAHAFHDFHRDRIKGRRRNPAGDEETLIERCHDASPRTHFDEEDADDRRKDRAPAERQRVENRRALPLEQGEGQHHGRDGRHGVGLEQVRGHAGTVADIVAHVVGNDGRIARIVFRNSRFNLADQVGADVRRLGIDPAADTRKDRDQTAAESQAQQRMDRFFLPRELRGQRVEAGDRQQAQADQQQPGHRPAAEGHGQGRVQAAMGRLRRADIRAHRDDHADIAGNRRGAGADQETDRRQQAEFIRSQTTRPQNGEQHGRHDADRPVLAVHVGARALLNRLGNFLHLGVAGVELEHPHGQIQAVGNPGHRSYQRERDNR